MWCAAALCLELLFVLKCIHAVLPIPKQPHGLRSLQHHVMCRPGVAAAHHHLVVLRCRTCLAHGLLLLAAGPGRASTHDGLLPLTSYTTT